MNDLETLRFELADNVARVTLNRPDAANAMNTQMTKDLLEVGIECDENPEGRAVLLRSEGRMFCAGGDLASFAEAGDALPRRLKEMTVYLHAAITRLARGRAPVVAAVQGPAAGGGFSLACAADLARKLAAGPTWAFGTARELVMRSYSEDLESQMEFESQAIADAARTEDAAEGIAAFFEKRRANFRGH